MHAQAHPPRPIPPSHTHIPAAHECTHQTLPILGPQVTGVITTLFFPNWQARKADRTCVCSQKTGLNWFGGGELSCVSFFFLLPLAKDLGAFDVQSAGI